MAGYRFCRSDDAQRLVEAYNTCYRVHFPDQPELTLDGFKRWVRELQVWASSCMIASGDRGEPIGVLIGAKRETANCVIALGVHPDHLRQGHGSHMLDSLGSKLAILGPPRVLGEVPEHLAGARACFEASRFRARTTYVDFELEVDTMTPESAREIHPLVTPIGLEEAGSAGLLENRDETVCWERWTASLMARKERLRGLAVASESRIEVALLHSVDESAPDECCIELLHVTEPRDGAALVGLMLENLRGLGRRRFSFARVHEREVPFGLFERLGFTRRERVASYRLDL
jgi:GNAT superfamily N-acetyltransferase